MRPQRLFFGLLLTLLGFAPALHAAEQAFSPVQAAYLQAETRKADEHFIAEVARITASPLPIVRRAMPPEGRITDPAARVIAAIEAQRKVAVSEAQRGLIADAEQQRRSAITNARAVARKR